MTISTERRGGCSLVRISGDLTEQTSTEFRRAVSDLLDGEHPRIVLDLSGVPYVTSAGLTALVRVTAQANSQQAALLLAQPSAFLAGVLESTRLNRFFRVSPTVDAAVASLDSSNG